MANGIRGDISLGAALTVLHQYDPCRMQFEPYEEMDQKLPAFAVWHQADPEDLKWVIATMDLFQRVPCYHTYMAEQIAADVAKSSIVVPAFNEWERAQEQAKFITDEGLRIDAQIAANRARTSVSEAAYHAWNASYRQAAFRYERALQSRETYRIVLGAVKAILKGNPPAVEQQEAASAPLDAIPY